MRIATRLTERFGVEHPILGAPMGFVAGGRLAAAVSAAGGLGLIGGGYGDGEWLDKEFASAGNARIGCGFITWSLAERTDLLDRVLERRPAAVMLSFGDPAPFAERIRDAGVSLICQVQSIASARAAIGAGADVVVAQGGEAGGHSGRRATFTLVPEVADLLARRSPETLLVAAGGIADGRALAAALALGADGVLVGSRLMASREAILPEGFRDAILAADGDATLKTKVVDVVRGFDWPSDEFAVRSLRNAFVAAWHGREADLADPETRAAEGERYRRAFAAGDPDHACVLIGEAVGLIGAVEAAGSIIEAMVTEACEAIAATGGRIVDPPPPRVRPAPHPER